MSDFYRKYLETTQALFAADRDAAFAIGLTALLDDEEYNSSARGVVREFVQNAADTPDVLRMRKAFAMLSEKEPLLAGVNFWNVRKNVSDCGGDIFTWGDKAAAGLALNRVIAANPDLKDRIENLEPVVPF